MSKNLFAALGVQVPDLLLPKQCDLKKWACIACDQYTSQPEIWEDFEHQISDAPSTLNLVLPEVYLDDSDARIPRIHSAMHNLLQKDFFTTVHGFLLTARTTQSGCRKGLMLAVDLEQYDYTPGSTSRVRATEGTILSRIPPRRRVRQGAELECPHIMLLIDDRNRMLIEPLYEKFSTQTPTYDTELLRDLGHLTGWGITDEEALLQIGDALQKLEANRGHAPLFAVGDGNHSLASAKSAWELLKPTLSPEEQISHPMRYALCEVVNLYDEALIFEPIHRVLTHVNPDSLAEALNKAALSVEAPDARVQLVSSAGEQSFCNLPIDVLQPALDAYLASHTETEIDYVHGDEAARTLGSQPDCCALLLTVLDKLQLFPTVARGPLPRKAFSMGEANEKRCYFECRKL